MPPRRYEYVLALLFTIDAREVVLVRKTRPAWQAGRVNALGGKIHEGESVFDAARREVREEAGIDVQHWERFLVWHDAEYQLQAVRAFDDVARLARSGEDQEVFLSDVGALPLEVIDNLRWIVPLALDRDVATPIEVRSANPNGSGLTERPAHA